MRFHGLRADLEIGSNFPGGLAFDQELQNLPLSRGQLALLLPALR